ncbi:MAG: hypothetical protein EHM54_04270 [Nitrospiraceae bacterium]|jgi:hypothetical protein|nr:MAG: hypothetical protein EHM54_04270 [Nitrospiraceae bacterium]
MPHFGLMDTRDSFEKEEGALLRARLHIRSGKRRLRQGKISAGIVTLYDAFLFALRWYVASAERRKVLSAREEDDLKDEKTVIALLRSSKVLEPDFDYAAFDAIVDKASREEMPDYDYSGMLRDFEAFMTSLGVMPFDEAELPPEDPATF